MRVKNLEEEKNIDISIENVVASASLDQKIDLLAIMKVFRNVEYRPKQFPGLVFRLKRPKTATLIFGSGKMVCTGAKSEKMARSAVNKVVRELKNNGIIILGKPKIVIQNIVASSGRSGRAGRSRVGRGGAKDRPIAGRVRCDDGRRVRPLDRRRPCRRATRHCDARAKRCRSHA